MGRKRKNKSSRSSKERKTRSEMGAANQDAIVPRRKEEGIEIPVPTRARDLPEIAKKIDSKLSSRLSKLNFLPATISSVDEAVATFMKLVALSKECQGDL
ncbi:hypothetical protein ACLB2K_034934 [Fragaria x ananassa]